MPPTARRALELARTDRAEATRMLGELSPDAQATLVCETPLARRSELLTLLPAPEEVVPRLPEAELCFTLKAIGLADAAWLLELASQEQVVASLDLDVWRGDSPDPAALEEWMAALAETQSDVRLGALRALDPELVVHYLKQRVEVELKPSDDESWQPPKGAQTLEGQFWLTARHEGDDLASVLAILRTLFEGDYWTYFRMLQGVVWEIPAENEEWALRWRQGRLEDLGFPRWEEAMQIYGHLPAEALARLPETASPVGAEAWALPVWLRSLPAGPEAAFSVFRAIAELEPEERQPLFYALVALANHVAVADRMPLGDAESTPRAIEKAARTASRGLDFLAEENALPAVEVLRRAPLQRLFRVGANLDPESARPGA